MMEHENSKFKIQNSKLAIYEKISKNLPLDYRRRHHPRHFLFPLSQLPAKRGALRHCHS